MKKAARFILVFLLTFALGATVSQAGNKYPNLNTPALLPDETLETVATLDFPPGNIATFNGRVFFTAHPEGHPSGPKLFELKNGTPVPYPDEDSQKYFRSVLGLATDKQGRLWTIDHSHNGIQRPRLMAFDLETGKIAVQHDFPRGIGQVGSYFNDLRVSPEGDTVYIADISFFRMNPAIVVYDVKSGTSRRLLQDHASVKAQKITVHSKFGPLQFFGGLVKLRLGVDGIAIDEKGEWLYFAPMNHDSVFRVRTLDLRDPSLDRKRLAARVERFATKPICDGIEMDAQGFLYITDVEHGTVIQIDQERKLRTLTASPAIRWPDGMAASADGYLYITDSDLPQVMRKKEKEIQTAAPFHIYRVKLPETSHES